MGLSWNTTRAMPRLTDYTTAAEHEAETKPIRGRSPEVKPLGRRDQSYRSIKREGNGDICVKEGHTVILRYRPDDTLLVYDPGYSNKASLSDVILEVTGLRTETANSKLWVSIGGSKYLIRPNPRPCWVGGKWVYPNLAPDAPLPENVFKLTEKFPPHYGYPQWTYVNPPPLNVHGIQRKAMRQVRERYAAFTAYAKAMSSLRKDNLPQPEEYYDIFDVEVPEDTNGAVGYYRGWFVNGMPTSVQDRSFDHDDAAAIVKLMASDDATDNYKAFLWLCAKQAYYGTPGFTTEKAIDRVLTMHHHAEVLALREVPAGKVAKERYMWAIPLQSQTT
jgi:hypothetical protein